ncbi:MAG: alanine--tRNA ligase [Nitrososphaerota archaeon]|nr:alanine--tRNA ligase [Nitrososphaerota archaeon]MDG6941500.1 alanine--tRNA ligase [Nitrososphaerota archaeon]MDG6951041.1 alanine--tRNA ligase [Nitrososphaerota archaeon]
MNEKKQVLKAKFSSDYKKYYVVDLFRRKGYVRKKCESCGKHFWTLKPERTRCDDQPCSPYTFIGDPPTSRRLGYVETWKAVEAFFKKNGHAIVKRYPVVSRWRPDLYFTVASIIDFQRVEGGKVVFALPANPLVVPQMCLRFNDVPTVGVNGKHGTSFCMIGQTALANREGYWKDRTIDLDFELLTKVFGINEEDVSFDEDVWMGYGAFGYSLQYNVRGLETGNAVFTAFEGSPEKYVQLREGVVDMGAGLERLTWLSQGTPTAYDSYFAPVLKKMREENAVEYDERLFRRYSALAGEINLDEYKNLDDARVKIAKALGKDASQLTKQFGALEAMYAIADHTRSLLFAIADGMLPSNSGGGYNLRMIYRRARNFINYYKFRLSVPELVDWHIDQLRGVYPELTEHHSDVRKVLEVEESRFLSSAERVTKIVSSIASNGRELAADDLVKLYDSDGVTPEQLVEAGAKVSPPEGFYEKVQARHLTREIEQPKLEFDVRRLPPTRLWYYEEGAPLDFTAKVLRVFQGGYVVLDRTVFYPRGGGQEPDRGTLGGAKVADIEKYGDVVIHKVEGKAPKAGSRVECHVDQRRRRRVTQIHTATHILNGSSREALGPWVWQHSAFKEEDYGRLDITHFSRLTEAEVQRIEDLANEVVRRDLAVRSTFMPRQEAEERYGFRLYQGGVVPGKDVRVVDIGGWDIEACGGTHVRATGEVGLIKITKAERVQDGVERLEFVAGEAAIEYMHRMDSELGELSAVLNTQRENLPKVARGLLKDLEESRAREKSLGQTIVELSSTGVAAEAKSVGNAKLYVSKNPPLGEEQIIAQGQKSVSSEPSLIYITVFSTGKSARIICFVGQAAAKAGFSAVEIVRKLASALGGSGGGSQSFAQGGGPLVSKIDEASSLAQGILPSATS